MSASSNSPHSADNPLEKLQGSVERVTFHSESSGFCVLRVKVKGQRELITVIGSAASVTAGEYIECQGFWVNDRQHGQQFKTISIKIVPPTTLDGIEKYLGSGMIKGIGPHLYLRGFMRILTDFVDSGNPTNSLNFSLFAPLFSPPLPVLQERSPQVHIF